MKTIIAKRISFVSLFKLMLAGFGAVFVPVFLLGGLAAFFGLTSWTYNGEELHGFPILLNALFCMGFFPVGFALMLSGVAFFGQFVFGLFKSIEIKVVVE